MCAKDYGGSLIAGKQWTVKKYIDGRYYIAEPSGGGTADHIGLSGKWEKWTRTIKLFRSREAAEAFARERIAS